MKQCPNPNCVFYTRLEELPDAYIKCPGCGGMLVDAGALSGKPPSSAQAPSDSAHTAQQAPYGPSLQYGAPGDTSPGLVLPRGEDTHAAPADQAAQPAPTPREYVDPFAAPSAQGVAAPASSAEGSPPGVVVEDPIGYLAPAPRWSTGSRTLFALAIVFLVSSCAIFAWLGVKRLLPDNGAVAGTAEATETALASLRPAVNTPIISGPTDTLPPLAAVSPSAVAQAPVPTAPPTSPPPADNTAVIPPTQQPPTQVPAPPTAAPVPPEPPTATAVVAQQPTPAPTAPPPQVQPAGGVVTASMSNPVAGGGSLGRVNEYSSTQPLNLAIQAQFGPGAVTSITTRWYGPDNTQIYEMRRDYTRPGTYYVAFTLRKNSPWTPGDYRVDVYTNDSPTPAYSVTFSVTP